MTDIASEEFLAHQSTSSDTDIHNKKTPVPEGLLEVS